MTTEQLVNLGHIPEDILHKLTSANKSVFVKPKNALEKALLEIWSKHFHKIDQNKISTEDNFFRLGGSSLSALRLVHLINDSLNIDLNVSSIFQHNTIVKLAKHILKGVDEKVVMTKLKVSSVEEQRLSFAQERLWFIEKYESGTNAYNIFMIYQLAPEIDIEALNAGIRSVVARHEILRTVIHEGKEGQGYQVVLDDETSNLDIGKETLASKEDLNLSLSKSVNHIYDLCNEYPIKVKFYDLITEPRTRYISIVIHHIAFDGWSHDIWLRDLQEYYFYYWSKARGIETDIHLTVLPVQYKDFALWQRNYLTGEKFFQQLDYWKTKLSRYERLNLLTDKPRPLQIDYKGNDITFEIDAETSEKLKSLARTYQVSLYSLLLSAYFLMLRVYSNQNDLIVGATAANRHYNQIEDLVGFFANTLVLRVKVEVNATIKSFIQSVGKEVIEAQLHQDLPFEKLVEELSLEKDNSQHPIFQVLFEVQSFGTTFNQSREYAAETDLNKLLKPYNESNLYKIAKFDISTLIDDSGSELKGIFNYAESLYTEETITGYVETYTHILKQLSLLIENENFEVAIISDLNYLNQARYKEVVEIWNETKRILPTLKLVHELFEEQVDKTPDRIAVVYGEKQTSYLSLNNRANQLARYLESVGFAIEDRIIVMMKRGDELLTTLLAILKCGGVYVPLDPKAPAERNKNIIKLSGAKIIIVDRAYDWLESCNKSLLLNLATSWPQIEKQNYSNLSRKIHRLNLAYIIFTSGSTGLPKGVMITHQGMANHIFYKITDLGIDSTDIVAQTATQVFDISIWQFLTSMVIGSKIVVYSDEIIIEPKKMLEKLQIDKITILELVPSYAAALAIFMHSEPGLDFKQLKHLLITGEKLRRDVCEKIFSVDETVSIINAYGPTECSDDVTHYQCKAQDLANSHLAVIPLGKVGHNLEAYIVNEQLEPVPVGALGELCISGIGLGRGYYNKPSLTAMQFIANPFFQEDKHGIESIRLYRTGDLCRATSEGIFEFIGRIDDQIKLRGYRIELGEIEKVLSSYADISQSVVEIKEGNKGSRSKEDKYLVGYYVSKEKMSEQLLESYLKSKLPDYMVPTYLVHLSELPLTINGKIDRKALPSPEFRSDSEKYIAPRNEIEKSISEIWSKVLGIAKDKISISDDFFRLGGDSIISIQLVSLLRQKLGLQVSVKDIFSFRTIERISEQLLSKSSQETQKQISTEEGRLSGSVRLLPIQEWFFKNNFIRRNHWNQSFLVQVPKLSLEVLKSSLKRLIECHNNFRLRYRRTTTSYEQYYDETLELEPLKILDVRTLTASEGSKAFEDELQGIMTQWQSHFDIERGPLYSLGYIEGFQDNSARLYFAFHHLIIDVVSWRILVKDLKELYEGGNIETKRSSYRQWSEAVKRYAESEVVQKGYWKEVLSDFDETEKSLIKLLLSEETREETHFILSSEETAQLLTKSNISYNTQVEDILLTAFSLSLCELTGSRVNHIVLEGHGREEIDDSLDVSGTVGWFTTIYPVRLSVDREISQSIKQVKENLRQIKNKGIGYGALIGYEGGDYPRISFNYLGQLNTRGAEQAWFISSDKSGESVHADNREPNIININCLVRDGKFEMHLVSKLSKANTHQLTESFKRHLHAVIEHCVTAGRRYITVSDVAGIASQERIDALQCSREIEAIYLANSLQQGFIYHSLAQGKIDDAYIIQLIWEYKNVLDIELYKQAWVYAQARYPNLRLRFSWDETLLQVIDRKGDLDWRYIDLSAETEKAQAEKIKRIQEQDRREYYDLEVGNLFRVYLIKQSESHYTCLLSNHHSILDGWSNPILLGYINDSYVRLLEGKVFEAEEDLKYLQAQEYLQQARKGEEDEFWRDYVSRIEEYPDLNGLLSSHAREQQLRVGNYRYIKEPKEKGLEIKAELYSALKEMCQREGVTLNAVLQYVWHKVLSVYGNSKVTTVGTVVSGRNMPIEGIETAVGLFINTLPLIVTHRNGSVLGQIKNIHQDINEISNRSSVNLAALQEGSERLFDSLFVYENYPIPNRCRQDKIKVEFKGSVEKLDYPLAAIIYEKNNQLIYKINFAAELFEEETIEEVLAIIHNLLVQIVENQNHDVNALGYLNTVQYQKIIDSRDIEVRVSAKDKTLHELFEEQVKKMPDKIALVYGSKFLTYDELNKRSNQLANYLRHECNVGAETVVAICLPRTENIIIAILAVLKAGGAYVPLDPNYPDARLQHVLTDSGANVILTDELNIKRVHWLEEIERGSQNKLVVLSLDDKEKQNPFKNQSDHNLTPINSIDNLAYVIYTSGTTGLPKGSSHTHRNICRLFESTNHWYNFNEDDVWSLYHSYVFDFSVWEMWGSLLYNGKLIIVPYDISRDFYAYTKIILQQKVSILNHTPTAFYQLADILIREEPRKLSHLRYVIFGGEALQFFKLQTFFNRFSNCKIKLINMYGITETSVHVTYKLITNCLENSSNIGDKIPDLKVYVLDKNLMMVPVGAIGELYVSGAGLGRGYYNKPALTAERFIANPYQTRADQNREKFLRLYKTGDLVRLLQDGSLEYLGRNDFQIKLRGYRIELGEIEQAISSYGGISQSVVLIKEENIKSAGGESKKYLLGYYVSKEKMSEQLLESYLKSKLPDYMVPTYLVHLSELPLTINGKIDRKALPSPEFRSDSEKYIAPRNEIEKSISEIWSKVLGIAKDKISISDDFFRLGGDSIISIQLVSLLRQKLGLQVSVKDIFSFRTIERISEQLLSKSSQETQKQISTEEGRLSGSVRLLPIQEWFFKNNFIRRNHWNQSFLVQVPKLSLEVLKSSLKRLIECHNNFRLRYRRTTTSYEQYYDETLELEPLKILDVRTLTASEGSKAFEDELQGIMTQWQSHFDIERGPLYSLGYIEGFQDNSARLYFAFHHLIIDVVSWRILVKDLKELYEGGNIETKRSSYRQWSEAVKRYAESEVVQKGYWKEVLSDFDETEKSLIKLLLSEETREETHFILSSEETAQLLTKSNISYNTQVEDILLTAFSLSLCELTGSRVNHIVLEGHGREEIDDSLDVSGTVGWFTTIYPVRLSVDRENLAEHKTG